jgi:hypothetical protein
MAQQIKITQTSNADMNIGVPKNMTMAQQTAVEWLAERYNYITWMRNRDEISPGTADEWRQKFLQEAKAMEKEQIIKAFESQKNCVEKYYEYAEQYYNETYQSNQDKPNN